MSTFHDKIRKNPPKTCFLELSEEFPRDSKPSSNQSHIQSQMGHAKANMKSESPEHITKTRLFKYTPKTENFQIKNSDIFHISAQNIDCGYSLEPPRRGGSNEYPQSMFLSRNKKIMYTPVNPSFTI